MEGRKEFTLYSYSESELVEELSNRPVIVFFLLNTFIDFFHIKIHDSDNKYFFLARFIITDNGKDDIL
jgi:hypothetical protein